MDSVARPDDHVHSFFARRAQKILNQLLEPDKLAELAAPFKPQRKPRRFTVATMVWLGVYGAAHAAKKSMQRILDAACQAIEGNRCLPLKAKSLTQSGWSRAKERMSLGFLRRLWRHWIEVARDVAGDVASFHGMRLVALDKKTITVPEALWPVFGSHRCRAGEGPAQGSLMVAYDVCVRVPVAVTLGRVERREYVLAPKILRAIGPAALILVDAGFHSIGLFGQVLAAGHQFLGRMPGRCKPKLVRAFGPDDGLYEIRPGNSWGKRIADVPRKMAVRILMIRRKGFRPMRVVTSLVDPVAFPREEMVDLYRRRWHIETFFRELQEDVEFQDWHTRSVKGLYVELLFTLIYVTVVRAEMAKAARAAGRLPGELSFGRGARVCIRAWCQIAKCEAGQRPTILARLCDRLGTLVIDVRPGRRFERNKQKRRAQSRAKQLQAKKDKAHAA